MLFWLSFSLANLFLEKHHVLHDDDEHSFGALMKTSLPIYPFYHYMDKETLHNKVIRVGTLIDKRDKQGFTLLHHAVRLGEIDIVTCLIKKGAKLDICDDLQNPPINVPSLKNGAEIRELLLKHGSPEHGCSKIHIAAKAGDLKTVKKSIDGLSYYDNFKKDITALYYAAKNGQERVVKYLIDNDYYNGGDRMDIHGKSIIEYSQKDGKDTIFTKYLRKKIELNTTDIVRFAKSLNTILSKEKGVAEAHNKKLLIMLGEEHYSYKIKQLEELIVGIANKMGVKQLAVELPKGEPIERIYRGAISSNMSTLLVDNHPYRNDTKGPGASIQERNIVMKQVLERDPQHSVLIVGAAHMKGLLESKSAKINTDIFHIVPFNLVGLIYKKNDIDSSLTEEINFFLNKRKVIQITSKSISSSKKPSL